MKRHPSSWSIVFAAPKNDARILRRSSRSRALPEAPPLVAAEEHEVDALLAALDEAPRPPRRQRSEPPEHDPELHVATVPLPFRPLARTLVLPPARRHEPSLAKVIVEERLLVPPPVMRRSRELVDTQLSMRRCHEALAELPTARPLAPAEGPRPNLLALGFGWCALALGLGSFVVAIVTSAGTM